MTYQSARETNYETNAPGRLHARDGFVISPAYLPGTFTEFVDTVVPELQRRGLFRTEYNGSTLKDHLRSPTENKTLLPIVRPLVEAGK